MVNISNTIGYFKHFISINRISSDGYIKNTDFSITNYNKIRTNLLPAPPFRSFRTETECRLTYQDRNSVYQYAKGQVCLISHSG